MPMSPPVAPLSGVGRGLGVCAPAWVVVAVVGRLSRVWGGAGVLARRLAGNGQRCTSLVVPSTPPPQRPNSGGGLGRAERGLGGGRAGGAGGRGGAYTLQKWRYQLPGNRLWRCLAYPFDDRGIAREAQVDFRHCLLRELCIRDPADH